MLTLENQDFEFWMQRPGSYLLPVRFRVKGLGLEHGNQPLAGPINIMARLVQTLERHSHLKCRVQVQGARFGICQREITTCRAKENRVSKIIEFWCKENRVSKRIEFQRESSFGVSDLEGISLVEITTCRMMEKATGRETVRPFRLRTRRLSRSDPPLINSIHI